MVKKVLVYIVKIMMLKVSWFPELLPEEKIIEEKIITIIKTTYQRFGYTPIETPAVERNSVLTAKWGNEVSKQIFWLYGLAQWCTNDTKDYSLHFDLTVPFSRYVLDHLNDISFPFKRSQIQKVRRWERAQKWRFREFYQADIDVIRPAENNYPFYDAEVIFVIITSLKDIFSYFNINKTFKVKINHKNIINGFLNWIKLIDKIQQITTIIDKKDKMPEEKFIELLKNENLTKEQIEQILTFINIQNISDLEQFVRNPEIEKWIKELENTLTLLKKLNIEKEIELDFWIMRWLDYYTWIVFETFIEWNRNLGSIASWWKYENFTKFIDDKKLYSGIWGSIWLSRLESFIFENIQKEQKTTTEYLLINFEETFDKILELYKKLISQWKKVEIYPTPEKIKKQFKYADKKWIKYCIILWEDEVKNWAYKIKNMNNGKEELKNL